MIFLWFIVWLLSDTPTVLAFGPWNDWGIALVVCALISLLSVEVRR